MMCCRLASLMWAAGTTSWSEWLTRSTCQSCKLRIWFPFTVGDWDPRTLIAMNLNRLLSEDGCHSRFNFGYLPFRMQGLQLLTVLYTFLAMCGQKNTLCMEYYIWRWFCWTAITGSCERYWRYAQRAFGRRIWTALSIGATQTTSLFLSIV